ncbi:MAG: hypothetical protein LQ348_003836 [Seirophora lacunosa]|nr:MAG: hypothetical protein LQ348_003836 [Seirophora lacunosa]
MEVFKKQLDHFFQEGETSTVELKDVDPLLIDQLISCFYTFQYSGLARFSKDREHQPLALNVEMYIIGDRYQLSGLKVLAKSKFSAALLHCWDKEPLTEIIRNIYENTVSTDRALRDALLPILQEHRQTVRVNEEFKEVVRTVGDFAVDLMDAWGAPAPAVVAVMPAKKRAKIE